MASIVTKISGSLRRIDLHARVLVEIAGSAPSVSRAGLSVGTQTSLHALRMHVHQGRDVAPQVWKPCGAGFLAGLGIIALPGIGPVVAAGWLASTLTGAAAGALAGGLIGALSDAGVEARAHYYTETVRRGGAIVSVRAADQSVSTVEGIMDAGRPIDAESRRAAYEREGWTEFDERAGPYRPASWSDLT